MKNRLTPLLIVAILPTLLFAQTSIKLELNHIFRGQPLVYNQSYTDEQDRAVNFSPVRYYMSSIKITHDGGQITPLDGIYVLADGNVTNYTIDSTYDITSVEKIAFDIGVDYDANHGNTSNWSASHPLGPKTPPMDWGWPAGYFFLVLDGRVDNTGDGNPNKPFQLECFGDELLRTIDPITFDEPVSANDDEITLSLYVNIERWFKQMDFETIGIQHGAYNPNVSVVDNTNAQKVFTTSPAEVVDIEVQHDELAFVSIDYSMPYAPTLFYKLPESNYSLSIIDLNGRRVVEETIISFEGNYFVKSELPTGLYFAIFTSVSGGYQKSQQFIVTR